MRKLYLFITFLMIFITLQAQNISVLPGGSYRDSTDLTSPTAISEQETENQNEKQTAKPAKMPVDYETSFFFTLNAAYAVNPQWSFGATVGAMKRWGGYLDLMVFESKDLVQKYKTMEEGKVYKLKDKSKTSRFSLMAGVVFRVCKPLSLHLGAGYGSRVRLYSAKELGNYVKSQSQYACSGNSYGIAKALASTTAWQNDDSSERVGNDPSSNNATGFSALPAGWFNRGGYSHLGSNAVFWSSTEINSNTVYFRELQYNISYVASGYCSKDYGFSVRCVKD